MSDPAEVVALSAARLKRLAEAKRDVEMVERFLREGYPAESPTGVTTSRSATRMAGEALNVARRTLDERIGSPTRVGSHLRIFGIQPDWTLERSDAAERARARRGEAGTRPVLTGFELASVKTRFDKAGKFAGETILQAPAAGPAFALPEGQAITKVTATVNADGRLGKQWIRYKPDGTDPAAFAAALRDAMQDVRGLASIEPPSDLLDDDLLTVYVIPDLHLGMMAHGAECGEDYDLKIASEMIQREIGRLLSMAPPSRNAVVLFLGDYFHMNDQKNATPRSGHTLDVDGRWRKVYGVGARVAVQLTRAIAERHRDVEVAFLPGNHDEDAALTLAVALELYFEGHDHVTVSKGAGIHWFRRFGKCLLGASHGHTMPPERMAMMLATDRAKDWGETVHRHFYYGHIHHATAKDVGPVRVESFSTPAAKDAYAAAGGYRSSRALNAVTFHAEDGEIARHRVNIRSVVSNDLQVAA